MKPFLTLAAALLAYSPLVWPGPVDLTDDRAAMTCMYYFAGVKFAWERPGGDWRDMNDAAYGDTAFARATVAKARKPQTVEWDITSLVRRWQNGATPSGGIYLRQLAKPASSVKFGSRESKQADSRPRLLIEWGDGSVSELQPTADTTMTCSSLRGMGKKKNLEVGNKRAAILIFPFVAKSGKRVRTAHLILHSPKQFGSPSDIGVFRLTAPFTRKSKPRQGLAAGFRADADITSHPAVVFATGFASSDWLDEWSAFRTPKHAERISQDTDNLFVPLIGDALKVTVRKGKKGGLNLPYRFQKKTGSEPEEMYFRYYLRLGDNWAPKTGGKLPGFSGTYNRGGWGGRRSDGTNGWSTRGQYAISRSRAEDEYALGTYAYHAGMKQKYGDSWGWGLGPTGLIKRNQWYSVEQYLKLNTPGKADGELKAWLDGNLIFDRTDLHLRDTRDLRIEMLWLNVYHGGVEKAPRDISLYIDNVVIAREYIGPAGAIPAKK